MARTKTITKIEETEPGDPVETAAPDLDAQTKDELETIEAARVRMGGACARVTIYRYEEKSGNWAFMGPAVPEIISDEFLQTNYGAGRYMVKFLGPDGRYISSSRAYIGATAPAEAKAPASAGAPAGAAVTREDLVTLQMEMLKAELQTQRDMVLRLIEKVGTPAAAEKSSSVAEIVTAIGSLGKLIPEPPNLLAQIRDLVGILKPLGLTGAAPAGSNWTDVVRDVLAAVPSVVEQMRMAKTVTPAEASAAAAVTGAPAQAAIKQDAAVMQLQRGIRFLKQEALDGQDVRLWIDFIVSHLGQAQWQPFVKFLEIPFEDLAKFDAEIATPAFRPWFENLWNGLKDAISERSASDGEPGDAPDAV